MYLTVEPPAPLRVSSSLSPSWSQSRYFVPSLTIFSREFQVGEDIQRFLVVSSEDLEDRLDVDIWVDKIKSMENVEIKECSYNMEVLLGKSWQDSG